MNILIAGKNGQVGNCLVDHLNTMFDITLLALGRGQLDITDATQVNKVIAKFNPNIIINAAAYTAVDKDEQESELADTINRDGPHYLAVAANEISATIIHISTDYVFSEDSLEFYVGSDQTCPQGEYGCGKQASERAFSRHVTLRTAWVFGEHGNNFVKTMLRLSKTMLRLSKTRDTLNVVADQFGDPTYAGDIAKAIATSTKQLIYGHKACGIYQYSDFPHVSWHTFAEKIFEIELEQAAVLQPIKVNPVTTQDYPTPVKLPAISRLNYDKINNAFGIQQSDCQEAIVRIKEYS
jgi:dTDP-4-dehydrorhamnose reductase